MLKYKITEIDHAPEVTIFNRNGRFDVRVEFGRDYKGRGGAKHYEQNTIRFKNVRLVDLECIADSIVSAISDIEADIDKLKEAMSYPGFGEG